KATAEEEANVKQLVFVSYPDIDLIPPYKEITASHDREGLELPEALYRVDKTEFNLNENSVQNYFIPKLWQYDDDYFPLFYYDKENLFFPNKAQNADFDDTRKFELRYKPYVLKGRQLKINISFSLVFSSPDYSPSEEELVDLINTVIYRISIGNDVIFFNYVESTLSNQVLNFNRNGDAEVELFHTSTESGALNIEIFEPFGDISDTHVNG